MASAAASTSYNAATAASVNYETFSDNSMPKFTQYRSQVMLGDLPADFLRIKFNEPAIRPHESVQMQNVHFQHAHNPNFLGFLTLTIAEAKLIKSSSLLGLMKMDPYVSFRIGHVQYETPTATGGGKSPQWKASYRLNLFRGMDRIYFEVFDQRNFTEDVFIGECEVLIPREVLEGETRQNWYPLLGRTNHENQGDILIIMSFVPTNETMALESANHQFTNNPTRTFPQSTVVSPNEASNVSSSKNAQTAMATSNSTAASNSPTHQQSEFYGSNQHSPSAIPKPPPPPYSQEDVQTIQEMFPTTDRRMIMDLLDKNGGNKDLVVNYLLQNIT